MERSGLNLDKLHDRFYDNFCEGFCVKHNEKAGPNVHAFYHLLQSRRSGGNFLHIKFVTSVCWNDCFFFDRTSVEDLH